MNRPAVEHVFIAGAVATGKSTLLRKFSRESERALLIYDPTHAAVDWHDGWRPGHNRFMAHISDGTVTRIYNHASDFKRALHSASDADVFVDEAADIFGQYDRETHGIVTKGRHNGLRFFFSKPAVKNGCANSADSMRQILPIPTL